MFSDDRLWIQRLDCCSPKQTMWTSFHVIANRNRPRHFQIAIFASVKCQCTLIKHIFSVMCHLKLATILFRSNQLIPLQKDKVLFVSIARAEPEQEM